MKNELRPKNTAISAATIAGVLYLACASLLAIAPQQTLKFFANMFHGIDITQIAKTTITFNSAILGFIEIVVITGILGWLFAVVYNNID